jgi:hypothetical protein
MKRKNYSVSSAKLLKNVKSLRIMLKLVKMKDKK